jgi:hypothetical protein
MMKELENAGGNSTVGVARISHKPSVGRSADTAEKSLCATLSADTLFPFACGARVTFSCDFF